MKAYIHNLDFSRDLKQRFVTMKAYIHNLDFSRPLKQRFTKRQGRHPEQPMKNVARIVGTVPQDGLKASTREVFVELVCTLLKALLLCVYVQF